MTNRHLSFAILGIILVITTSFVAKQKYKSENIQRRVILDIPIEFKALTEEEIILKTGMDNLPLAVFTDPLEEVNLSIMQKTDSLSHAQLPFESTKQSSEKDLTIEKAFFKSSLKNLYNTTVFTKDTVMEINGFSFIALEFDSKISGEDKKGNSITTEQYNYIISGYRKHRNYIINFSCPVSSKSKFQEIAQHIITSVNI